MFIRDSKIPRFSIGLASSNPFFKIDMKIMVQILNIFLEWRFLTVLESVDF